ncbi:MAG: transglycosylase domain-containing protein [Bacteroidota bacterium]
MSKRLVRTIVILLWTGFIIGAVSIILIFQAVKADYNNWFGGLPSAQALERPDPNLSSELISADGVLLGKYFRDNRTNATYEELSPEIVNTLLVTEDIRFKKHSGIDLRGLFRAIIGKLTFSFNGGGSTITMQLAENLYSTSTENKGTLYKNHSIGEIITKLKEWIIAVRLEQSYTKEEILAMYLNTVEYGSNSLGIKVAAKTFFNKLPSQLDYKEAALLVGAINAPTRYSPILNPENAKNKRTEVLYNLHKYGLIDRVAFDSLKVSDFGLNYKVESHNEGLATYFRTQIGNYLLGWTRERNIDLYADGIKIYTTLDSRMQEYAEEAVREHMDTLQQIFNTHLEDRAPWIDEEGKEIPDFLENAVKRTDYYKFLINKYGESSDSVEIKLEEKRPMRVFSYKGDIDTVFNVYDSLRYFKSFLQTGFVAMDPKSGHIKAWVGGIDHKYFQYDHVTSKRQPGSTFKPFVYTVAIDNGYSPCFPVVDQSVTLYNNGDPWTPENSNGKFTGEKMTIRQAMARSVNSITAFMMGQLQPSTVRDYARRMGIESPLDAVPAMGLGAGGDVSVFEMVGAYSTFVNRGTHTTPFFIDRIEDQNGNVIQQFTPDKREAINEETAYIMLHMLKGVTEFGTAFYLSDAVKSGNEIGAKTGTTQNASDGWFMGVTKDLAAGAWVGGEERSIHFRYWGLGQGARTAMPIWDGFMQRVYADPTLGYVKGPFPKPTKPLSIELDCTKYEAATQPGDSTIYQDVVEEEAIF